MIGAIMLREPGVGAGVEGSFTERAVMITGKNWTGRIGSWRITVVKRVRSILSKGGYVEKLDSEPGGGPFG